MCVGIIGIIDTVEDVIERQFDTSNDETFEGAVDAFSIFTSRLSSCWVRKSSGIEIVVE